MIFYRRILSGEKIENAGAFLYKIADNIIKSQWRQDKKMNNIVPLDEVSETVAVPETVDCGYIDFDLYAKKIVKALDEKEQTVYKLKYVDGRSIAEISEELNISFDAVAKRLSRMRQKVKKIIAEETKGDELL